MYMRLFFVLAALCVLAFAACGEVTDEEESSSADIITSSPGGASSVSSAVSLAPSILAFEGADFEGGAHNTNVPQGDALATGITARYSTYYYKNGSGSLSLYNTSPFTTAVTAYVSPANLVSSVGYSKFSFWIQRGGEASGTPSAIAIGFGNGAPGSGTAVFYLKDSVQSSYNAGDWVTSGATFNYPAATTFLGTDGYGNDRWEKVTLPLPTGFTTLGKPLQIHYGAVSGGTQTDYYFDDFKFEL